MKLIGMIGGTGPESTIDYYQQFIKAFQEAAPEGGYPPVVINSIDGVGLLKLMEADDWDGVADRLLEEIRRMQQAGVAIGLLTSNTLHLVFERLRSASPIRLISSVETCRQAAEALRLRRVGLIGTRPTMQGGYFRKVFAEKGIDLVTPDVPEQDYLHSKYFSELVHGMFLPETRDRFVRIAQRLQQEEGIEALVLGGSEIPMLLRGVVELEMPLLDTTRLHVARAVTEMLQS